MDVTARQRGTLLLSIVVLLALGLATAFAVGLTGQGARLARDRASDRALAQAKEALIAYAASRPIDASVGPGYLPCPDLDGDGWAESTCGSLSGHTGQAQRLGRLPWKTLGLAELRDGYGEPLWYAVSAKHKGLLNCAASAGCVDMNPDSATGTITVRDASGLAVLDGKYSGAAAVVLAPGAPLERLEDGGATRRVQTRSATATPDPADYLDKAPGDAFANEDNAEFTDRSDARSGNGNGFIAGPVRLADGTLAVNDRIAALAQADLMPRVMRRVALEVLQCLRTRSWPAPVPTCLASDTQTGTPGVRFGRVPEASLAACGLAGGEGPGWWSSWRRYVFYALGVQPVDAAGRALGLPREAAVIVAGPALAGQVHGPATEVDVRHWLEGPHRELERLNPDPPDSRCPPSFSPACVPGECNRVVLAPPAVERNDVAIVWP